MNYNGKTATATILDECPGCPYGGLDLSRGLFDFFASESEGVIYGSWDFVSDSQPTTSPNTPTTTSTPAYTPPTTTTTPSPTPTPTPSSTSTWSSSIQPSSDPSNPQSSSSSSSITLNYSSGPASNLAVPTGTTVSDTATHNLLALNEDMVALGGIAAAGARI